MIPQQIPVAIHCSFRMFLLTFAFAIMLKLAKTQAFDENNSDINEANTYDTSNNCIGKYKDLQSYVLNNEDLMDELTELFFETGKIPTKFVKITYRFQILLPVDSYSDNTNETVHYSNYSEFTCINSQKKFIWSSSALYLLGPAPLFWMTLFAVYVPETSATINLPCLCNDAYDDLLSRLTYLVSSYVYDIYIYIYIYIYYLVEYEYMNI